MLLFLIAIIVCLLALGAFLRVRRWQRQQQIQRQKLRNWIATQNVLEPALQQWILRLAESEFQVFAELLFGYCRSLDWELDWLFTAQIAKAPVLKAEIERGVKNYTHSIFRSLQIEGDVQSYKTYLAFAERPTARKHRVLVKQLYTKIENQDTTAPAKSLFRRFRRKKVSRQQMIDVIQRAFDRDPPGTMAMLKEVVTAEADENGQPFTPEQTQNTLSLSTQLA